MSDYPPASANKSPAFADALQRARQIASKIKPESGGASAGVKRPLEDPLSGEGPVVKKSAGQYPGYYGQSGAAPPAATPGSNYGGYPAAGYSAYGGQPGGE